MRWKQKCVFVPMKNWIKFLIKSFQIAKKLRIDVHWLQVNSISPMAGSCRTSPTVSLQRWLKRWTRCSRRRASTTWSTESRRMSNSSWNSSKALQWLQILKDYMKKSNNWTFKSVKTKLYRPRALSQTLRMLLLLPLQRQNRQPTKNRRSRKNKLSNSR